MCICGFFPASRQCQSRAASMCVRVYMHSTSPRPKKAREVRSNVKMMLTVFFDSHGVVHHEYAPQSQNINKEYYLEVLCRLHDAMW